jgi:hypothetical protein
MDLEVVAVTAPAEHEPEWPDDEVPTEELACRVGAQPIASVEELHALAHPDLWDSDEKYEEFLADLYASRHTYIG